jgi:hypothetical protein
MKRFVVILFSIIYIISSCNTVSKETKLDEKMNDTLNIVSYAENFKIYPIESGFKLVIKDLSSENEFYLFKKINV